MTGQRTAHNNTYQYLHDTVKHRPSQIIVAFLVVIIMLVTVYPVTRLFAQPDTAKASGPAAMNEQDILRFYEMAQEGRGQEALNEVASNAQELGAWAAAPGDAVVFDPYMMRQVRGAVIDYDDVPEACNATHRGRIETTNADMCINEFRTKEAQVRFGMSFFSTPTDDGLIIRTPDDVLATYIEETGHSWQEYAFETEGRYDGNRSRQTSMSDSLQWGAGREYQIKVYILSLDGDYITLSEGQRTTLLQQMCNGDGYANPLGKDVPAYGAPPNWPNPDAWPVEAPSLSEHMEFCASQLS
jgi:hypothetical protein